MYQSSSASFDVNNIELARINLFFQYLFYIHSYVENIGNLAHPALRQALSGSSGQTTEPTKQPTHELGNNQHLHLCRCIIVSGRLSDRSNKLSNDCSNDRSSHRLSHRTSKCWSELLFAFSWKLNFSHDPKLSSLIKMRFSLKTKPRRFTIF